MRPAGDRYGLHRVLIPAGAFPQAAEKLDNSLPIFAHELLIDVECLNIDSASFQQIQEKAHGTAEGVRRLILEIVQRRGKLHNPVTNSGGMLLGRVREVGKSYHGGNSPFAVGERIATLVSLTLTPLHLEEIVGIVEVGGIGGGQVRVQGHAILFESGVAHRLPPDLPEQTALAIFDVCGAPALASHLIHAGGTVVVLGAGKAGLLVAAEARKKAGRGGKVFLLDNHPEAVTAASALSFIDQALAADATDPQGLMETVSRLTEARMADLVVNCVNIPGTEMASILTTKHSGTVLFFNMATNFQAAVLGAEGIGHETRLVMGNGYTPGHADLALNLVREFPDLRAWFEKRFARGESHLDNMIS